MKKLQLIIAMSFMSWAAMAQHTETITMKKIAAGKVPVAVIDAFEEDYPDIGGIETYWFLLPYTAYDSEWEITASTDEYFQDNTPDHYTVTMKGKNFKKQALYDADGNLVYSKEVVKDTGLPIIIKNELSNSFYKDWEVVGDKEVIKHGNSNLIEYKVIVEKQTGKTHEKQALYFDENGHILHSSNIIYRNS